MNLNKSKLTTIHWWTERLTAISLIPWILIININAILILSLSLILHLRTGLEIIFEDYVHQNNTKVLGFLLIRIFTLYILYYTFEFLT